MSVFTAPARPLARALLAPAFVILGYEAAREPGGRTQKAANLGVPAPELAVRANGAAMALFGVTMALGIKPRLSALALAVLLVPTTLAGHPYWEEATPQGRQAQVIQLLKNVGLAGGLVAVALTPSGRHRGRERAREAAAIDS